MIHHPLFGKLAEYGNSTNTISVATKHHVFEH